MPAPYIWDEKPEDLPNKTLVINQAVEHITDWLKREPDTKVDGHYEKRIDINDVKHKFAITRQQTRDRILKETGAKIEVKGKYYPDRSLAIEGVPPLFLEITASSQRGLNAALKLIQDQINNAGVITTKEKLFDPRYVNATVDIGIEQEPGFDVRIKLLGPGNANIKYIHTATGCKVQLKGKGSGYVDPNTGLECDDPLFFHIMYASTHIRGNLAAEVDKAKTMVTDLLETIRQDHVKYLATLRSSRIAQPPMGSFQYGAAYAAPRPTYVQYSQRLPPGVLGLPAPPGLPVGLPAPPPPLGLPAPPTAIQPPPPPPGF